MSDTTKPTMTNATATPKPPANIPQASTTPQEPPNTAAAPPSGVAAAPPVGAVTSANVKPPREIDPNDPWEGATAVPLSAPAIDQLKAKNPNIQLRYFNRVVATSATPHLRYEQALAMGWVPAKPEDLVSIPPGTVRDGLIQVYDVILMKIDKQKYLGDLRWKNERVNRAVQRPGAVAGAGTMLQEELNRAGVSKKSYTRSDGSKKVSVFVP